MSPPSCPSLFARSVKLPVRVSDLHQRWRGRRRAGRFRAGARTIGRMTVLCWSCRTFSGETRRNTSAPAPTPAAFRATPSPSTFSVCMSFIKMNGSDQTCFIWWVEKQKKSWFSLSSVLQLLLNIAQKNSSPDPETTICGDWFPPKGQSDLVIFRS